MRATQREHFPGAALGWGVAMNLFTLIFALILAVLFTILLLAFVGAVEQKAPKSAPERGHAAGMQLLLPR